MGTFWPWSLLFIPIPVRSPGEGMMFSLLCQLRLRVSTKTSIYFWLFQFARKSIRQFQCLVSMAHVAPRC